MKKKMKPLKGIETVDLNQNSVYRGNQEIPQFSCMERCYIYRDNLDEIHFFKIAKYEIQDSKNRWRNKNA